MAGSLEDFYDAFYRQRDPVNLYPAEFVVRAFLGNYPHLKNQPANRRGQKVLDLGFGDGRNMPLLHDLGMEIHGVEISESICELARVRMSRLGIPMTARVGRNREIPFDDSSFDCVLACHSCYYVDPGSQFSDNVAEIARVLRNDGTFVFSAPMGDSYILNGADDLGGGHMRVQNDPYGIRNGCVMRKFDHESEIKAALSPLFENFAIGSWRNDFWGIQEYVWIVVCKRVGESSVRK